MDATSMLIEFGLTNQEAKLYIALSGHGAATGYEAARLTSISRSNAYGSLDGLVDKGAARVVEGKPQRFVAVPAGEFCANRIRRLESYRNALEAELVLVDEADCPYLTIRGDDNIADKVADIIASTTARIYLAMPAHLLAPYIPALEGLTARGIKVVAITDGDLVIDGATVYRSSKPTPSLRVIGDSAMTLTGEIGGSGAALFSMKRNLVNLIRDSIRNEIQLITLSQEAPPQ
ncbi:MAG: hypothetical protein LUC93_13850 [Planctomycetaceae bacterium]|nr:hypothetical protein [Planctomycetaceae bacterium]